MADNLSNLKNDMKKIDFWTEIAKFTNEFKRMVQSNDFMSALHDSVDTAFEEGLRCGPYPEPGAQFHLAIGFNLCEGWGHANREDEDYYLSIRLKPKYGCNYVIFRGPLIRLSTVKNNKELESLYLKAYLDCIEWLDQEIQSAGLDVPDNCNYCYPNDFTDMLYKEIEFTINDPKHMINYYSNME